MSHRPHVLLVTTDHWPAALLGCAGHSCIETPTLDQLARCGTRYTNAYSECPVCIPARRTLMTGMTPRSHGDRTFQTTLMLPKVVTMAQAFRNADYQAFAVGKLHAFPQRNRVGFDDVVLAEEGRPHWGVWDDYDIFLGEQGHVGRQFDHGMSNNQYIARPWHLPEDCHVTNWTTREMARAIRRRDPTRPAFWHLSYTHPHPPLVPPVAYWSLYQNKQPPWPVLGDWTPATWSVPEQGQADSINHEQLESMPYRLQQQFLNWHVRRSDEIRTALRAFYALCTHIDHQLRVVIGTLREEGLLDDTIILFSADHGDMLGDHGLWAKRLFYEGSANVPMILVGTKTAGRIPCEAVDNRLVGWQDIMPTLLQLADIQPPETCDGRSMVDGPRRDILYGECNEGSEAVRMVHDGQYKLIYYAAGNQIQLFDLNVDAKEQHDVSESAAYRDTKARLLEALTDALYGSDLEWLNESGELTGLAHRICPAHANRGLALQRGTHWPPAPVHPPKSGETNPGTN